MSFLASAMDLKVGDRIERSFDYAIDPPIEIVAVRPTGYSWRYVSGLAPNISPHHREPVYESDNTNDPFFERGWRLMEQGEAPDARNGLPLDRPNDANTGESVAESSRNRDVRR